MVELRVIVSDELAEELARRAREQHTTAEELAVRAVESRYSPAPPGSGDPKGFIGMLEGDGDVARHVDEILRGEIAR